MKKKNVETLFDKKILLAKRCLHVCLSHNHHAIKLIKKGRSNQAIMLFSHKVVLHSTSIFNLFLPCTVVFFL